MILILQKLTVETFKFPRVSARHLLEEKTVTAQERTVVYEHMQQERGGTTGNTMRQIEQHTSEDGSTCGISSPPPSPRANTQRGAALRRI